MDAVSAIFRLRLILFDKDAVSLANRLLNIDDVSAMLSFNASEVVTSAAFAFSARLVFTSDVFAFNANAVLVASPLRSWSPVLVPVMAASFAFSAVV